MRAGVNDSDPVVIKRCLASRSRQGKGWLLLLLLCYRVVGCTGEKEKEREGDHVANKRTKAWLDTRQEHGRGEACRAGKRKEATC